MKSKSRESRIAVASRQAKPGSLLPLAALWGLAVAQPLYDLLKSAPEFFVEHDVSPGGLLAFVFVLSFACPLLLAGIVLVVRLSLGIAAGRAVLTGLLAILGTAVGAQLSRLPGSIPAPLAIAMAVTAGLVLAGLFRRSTLFASGLAWLAVPVWLLLPGLFLLASPIRGLWNPRLEGIDSATGTATSVVMIVFDELPLASLVTPADEVDAARFPAFAELARSSTWFRNTTTPAASTSAAVPALLTGNLSRQRRAPVVAEYPRNLFTALAGSHDLRVIERVTRLCPRDLCPPVFPESTALPSLGRDLAVIYAHLVLPVGWRHRLPPVDRSWRDFGGGRKPPGERKSLGAAIGKFDLPGQVVSAFTPGLRLSTSPTLHYLHLMVPHTPLRFLPSGQIYELAVASTSRSPTVRKFGVGETDEWALLQEYQRHLLQVQFADRLLGDIVATMRDGSLWDSSLLIVTADHGASFAPRRGKRGGLESLNVPLMIKRPGQTGGEIVDASASLLDVLPTIFEVLELEVDWKMAGRSVFSPPPQTQTPLPRPAVTAAGRLAVARAKVRNFPQLDENAGLFRIGPRTDLLNLPVEHCPGAPNSSDQPLPRATIGRRVLFDDVDPNGIFLPARVVGRLDFGAAAPRRLDLAVAINGKIAAMTHNVGGMSGDFSAMVPPDLFTRGKNKVEIHLVRAGPAPCLDPLTSAARDYELVSQGADSILVSPAGERITVGEDPRLRFKAYESRSHYLLRGSPRSDGQGRPPRTLAFYHSLFVGELKRSNAVNGGKESRVQLRVSQAVAPRTAGLRVIVIDEGGAVEATLDWRKREAGRRSP